MKPNFRRYIFIALIAIYFGLFFYYKDTFLAPYIYYNSITQNTVMIINSLLAWVTALLTFSVFGVYLEKWISKLTNKTKFEFDNILGDFFVKFYGYAKYLASAYIALYFVKTSLKTELIINNMLYAGFILIGLLIWTSLINVVFDRYIITFSRNHTLASQLLPFINKAIIVFIWLFGGIVVLDNLGFDVTALVAWAWVWGLALALAAQKSVANIFGAITVILNKPFKIWDFINVDGFDGTVRDIWITYMTLVSSQGHTIYIPNERLISGSVQNFSERETRRADFSIGLIYNTTLEQMRKWVEIIEWILEDYKTKQNLESYRVNFDNFGAFSLNINATYFTNETAYTPYLKQKEEINIEIKEAFAAAGLEMAFPTQELIIKKEA